MQLLPIAEDFDIIKHIGQPGLPLKDGHVAGASLTTYTYDSNGNLTKVQEPAAVTTLGYDKANRLVRHEAGATITTYAYDADGQKRTEQVGAAVTTLVWDGQDYLQARS